MTATLTSGKQSSVKASGLALIGAVTTMVATFGVARLVSENGVGEAGVFFLGTALVSLLGTTATFGTPLSLVYFMPTVMAEENPNPRDLIRVACTPVLISGVAFAALVFVGAGTIGELFGGNRAEELASVARWLAPTIPAWALGNSLLGATRGLGTVTPTMVIQQVGRPLAQMTFLFGLLVSGELSALSASIAWGAPVLLGAVAAAVAVARQGGFDAGDSPVVGSSEFWTYCRPHALTTGLQIAVERLDVLLVGLLLGEVAAGVYGGLSRFATAGNFIVFAVAQAVSPNLRTALKHHRFAEATTLLHQASSWMVLIAWPYLLIVALKPEPLARLLQDDYVPDARILSILVMGMMVSSAAGPIKLHLLMRGHPRATLATTALSLVTDIVLLLALTNRFGIGGAAAAWAFSVGIENVVNSYLSARWHGVIGLAAPALRAMGAAVVMVVPIALLTPNTFAGLVLTTAGAGVLMLGYISMNRAAFGLNRPGGMKPVE